MHSVQVPCEFEFTVTINRGSSRFFVNLRPHVRHFLRTASQWYVNGGVGSQVSALVVSLYLLTPMIPFRVRYDVVIFTASVRDYADKVVDRVDSMGVVSARFYRDSCRVVRNPGEPARHIKDISIVREDRNLSKVVLIDNTEFCFFLNPDNGILIKSWFNGSDRVRKRARMSTTSPRFLLHHHHTGFVALF